MLEVKYFSLKSKYSITIISLWNKALFLGIITSATKALQMQNGSKVLKKVLKDFQISLLWLMC